MPKQVRLSERGYFDVEEQAEEKVIQFDLPKGYSARDAYYSALYLDSGFSFFYKKGICILTPDLLYHFGESWAYWYGFSTVDRANFYLLLAYANGFKD
jgi:hypothetical protein